MKKSSRVGFTHHLVVCLIAFLLFPNCLRAQTQRYPIELEKLMSLEENLLYTNEDSAMKVMDIAWQFAESTGDLWVMGITSINQGVDLGKIGRHEEAYLNYFRAAELFKEADTLDLRSMADAYRDMADLNMKYEDYSEAIGLYRKSLELLSIYPLKSAYAFNDSSIIIKSQEVTFDLAVSYLGHELYEESEKLIYDLLQQKLYSEYPGRHGLLNELGVVKRAQKQYFEAIELFMEVVDDSLANIVDVEICMNNIGITYQRMREYRLAEYWIGRSVEVVRGLGNSESEFISLMNLGEVLLEQQKHEKALQYFLKAEDLMGFATHYNLDYAPFYIYDWISRTYDSLGMTQLSKAYALTFNNSLENHKRSGTVLMAAREKASFHSLIQSLKESAIRKELEHKGKVYTVIISLTCSGFIIAFFLWRRRAKRRQMFKQLKGILLKDL